MASDSSANQIQLFGDSYGVKLEVFEGPLDLLLYLIKREEIDIYDIPVAHITRQYLEYVELIKMVNIEQAGDFVLMAATLMKIKSQMLLPRQQEDEEEEEDPREELVRRLLDYQRYKEIAEWMDEREIDQKDVFYRTFGPGIKSQEEPKEGPLITATLFDLLYAFRVVLESAPKVPLHRIRGSEVHIEEQMDFILMILDKRKKILFMDLVSGQGRLAMIVTFIAILELIKTQRISAVQNRQYEDIWIHKKEQSDL